MKWLGGDAVSTPSLRPRTEPYLATQGHSGGESGEPAKGKAAGGLLGLTALQDPGGAGNAPPTAGF